MKKFKIGDCVIDFAGNFIVICKIDGGDEMTIYHFNNRKSYRRRIWNWDKLAILAPKSLVQLVGLV